MDQSKKFFQWKDTFSVGIDELDKQHRSFLELLNRCYDSIAEHGEQVVNEDLIKELEEYVAVHFRYEEEILEHTGYQGLEQQRTQHKYFQFLVADLDTARKEGNAVKLKSTLSILRDWFLHHILEEDIKYIPYLRERR